MGRTPKVSTEVTEATVKKYKDQLICNDGKSKYLLFIFNYIFDFFEFNTYLYFYIRFVIHKYTNTTHHIPCLGVLYYYINEVSYICIFFLSIK